MAAINHVATAALPVIIIPPTRHSRASIPVPAAQLDHDDPSLAKRHRPAKASHAHAPDSENGHSKGKGPSDLSEEEQKRVTQLKARDREVRTHEQAHKNAGGPYAGSPTYEYTRGPDGSQYAISGEVSIDASPISGNASATIAKMEIVIRAALAPAEPSGQDMKVAAQARAAKTQAQSELRREESEEQSTGFAALRQRLGLEDSVDGLTAANKATKAYQSLENLLQDQARTNISFAA
ncbi:MAG: putative metalloprotease CJM1_0395 family protein [Alphaproteobacteria bacterium]